MKTWKTWTEKEIDELERLRLDGLFAHEIAARLGRTVPSVKCRLGAEGIAFPRRLERRLEVLAGEHTIKGAAEKLGVTKWAVKQAKRKLRRAGFDIPAATRKTS